MGGTILNMITVAIGSTLGLLIGGRLPHKIQESVVTGLGLVTLFVGFSNAGQTGNVIIPLISLLIGVIVGELLNLDAALERLAGWLQRRFAASGGAGAAPEETANDARARFITGFVTASLVFCIGPLTFVGSIQDGMGLPIGFQQLAIKSVLDGFAGMAFAASFGVGVSFSILTVLVVQGGLALAGSVAGYFMSGPMVNEMTAVGGLLLIGLGLVLLDIKRPRMANFLPSLVVAPLLVALAGAVGINIYPFS
ncbi:MAG: DUF554 domain-containing protein [Chloroflexi bacterium]|nr:DUF554 domain-containing protein [Chloroflexota bacterium]MDL1883059.1 DUF554 domain-containing protein [Anaerolineae bacterium CFX8]